jgi:hypothetical protein
MLFKIALRGDTEGDPRSGEGVRPSSPSIQIAKQNRSAGTPAGRSGDSAGARPPAEHAVWHSEVKRKGVAGGTPQDVSPDMYSCTASFFFLKLKRGRGGCGVAHTTRHVFVLLFFLFSKPIF